MIRGSYVTPFVGVWIETFWCTLDLPSNLVTPFVGVWIETALYRLLQLWMKSHPSWVCGLKLGRCGCKDALERHTLRGCVDWNSRIEINSQKTQCHTLRGCVDWNSPSWAWRHWRKVTPFVGVWIETNITKVMRIVDIVTPFVGVWIETPIVTVTSACASSHPSWVCGLKLSWFSCRVIFTSHTLRGCVDWNNLTDKEIHPDLRHTLRGCVDWNSPSATRWSAYLVTPFVGVWIETSYLRGV